VKITIAFYKGKGSILNKVVRWWTKSRYSHAELILPDGVTWIGISPVMRSKIESKKKLLVETWNWEYIDITVNNDQVATILEFFDETRGQGYDWVGMLLSQFLPCKIKHRARWYCSEWISYALRIACIIDWKIIKIYDRKDLSPGVLYDIVSSIKDEKI